MSAPPRIPAAAPARVRSVLAGPERPARVVHRGSDAVYLEVDGSCIGVVSTGATAVPCALRTALPALPGPVRHATRAAVGGGLLVLGGTEVDVVRDVDAGVPPLDLTAAAAAQRHLDAAVGSRVDHVCAELPVEALEALAVGDAGGVTSLLGRGSGLTPLGDDVLAGWVATVVAASAPVGAPVVDAVARHASAMTTLLSATLLDCARRGEVVPEFRRLLADLTAADAGGVAGSVAALLRVGHTSGAGLVLGTLLALRHLAPRSTP